MKTSLLACFAMAAAIALLDPARAEACGGCFVQQTERTVVTDHRMALAVSPEQTVLWDQIRYSGDPAEFAWVLPVRSGATIQLSNDEFFAALDASSQPVVRGPATYGGGYGCGLTGCSSQADSTAGAPGAGQVQIVSQSVIGPYESVTLRATDPRALRNWLKSHAYEIPPAVEPVIDKYVQESFDFIALRLRPDCGERSMQPVRIVTPGADPTLPLRMVAAGIGAKVDITLYVISEGRWQPRNFPHALVNPKDVQWDRTQSRSNYQTLTEQLMAQSGGHTWVVEYADRPQLFAANDPRYPNERAPGFQYTGDPNGVTPGLADTYYGQCRSSGAVAPVGSTTAPSAQPFTPCRSATDAGVITPSDAGVADAAIDSGARDAGGTDAGAGDAGDPDAGDPDAGDPDAGTADAGSDDDGGGVPDAAPTDPPFTGECLNLDDIDVALRGLHPQDVWVTRMRASLAANLLAEGDLKLEAALEQTPVSNVYNATTYTDETSAGQGSQNACLSAPKRHTAFGSWALATIAAIVGVAFLRRRTRR